LAWSEDGVAWWSLQGPQGGAPTCHASRAIGDYARPSMPTTGPGKKILELLSCICDSPKGEESWPYLYMLSDIGHPPVGLLVSLARSPCRRQRGQVGADSPRLVLLAHGLGKWICGLQSLVLIKPALTERASGLRRSEKDPWIEDNRSKSLD
jgi:hypothetical protein